MTLKNVCVTTVVAQATLALLSPLPALHGALSKLLHETGCFEGQSGQPVGLVVLWRQIIVFTPIQPHHHALMDISLDISMEISMEISMDTSGDIS